MMFLSLPGHLFHPYRRLFLISSGFLQYTAYEIHLQMTKFPLVSYPDRVGEYPALVKSGGGYVWDELLEYRVWCHPEDGAADVCEGDDYYHAFATYEEALEYSQSNPGCEEPLALVLQREYIDEPETGVYIHIKEERFTEWPVEFLSRPRRTDRTIPDFLSSDAPENRLDIIRGLV